MECCLHLVYTRSHCGGSGRVSRKPDLARVTRDCLFSELQSDASDGGRCHAELGGKCEFLRVRKKGGKKRSTSGNPPCYLFRRLLLLRSPPCELTSATTTAALRPALISLHHLATLLRPAQVGERGRGATGSRSRHDLGSSCSGGGARSRGGRVRRGGGGRVGGESGERSRAQRDAGEEGEEHGRVALQSWFATPQRLSSQ